MSNTVFGGVKTSPFSAERARRAFFGNYVPYFLPITGATAGTDNFGGMVSGWATDGSIITTANVSGTDGHWVVANPVTGAFNFAPGPGVNLRALVPFYEVAPSGSPSLYYAHSSYVGWNNKQIWVFPNGIRPDTGTSGSEADGPGGIANQVLITPPAPFVQGTDTWGGGVVMGGKWLVIASPSQGTIYTYDLTQLGSTFNQWGTPVTGLTINNGLNNMCTDGRSIWVAHQPLAPLSGFGTLQRYVFYTSAFTPTGTALNLAANSNATIDPSVTFGPFNQCLFDGKYLWWNNFRLDPETMLADRFPIEGDISGVGTPVFDGECIWFANGVRLDPETFEQTANPLFGGGGGTGPSSFVIDFNGNPQGFISALPFNAPNLTLLSVNRQVGKTRSFAGLVNADGFVHQPMYRTLVSATPSAAVFPGTTTQTTSNNYIVSNTQIQINPGMFGRTSGATTGLGSFTASFAGSVSVISVTVTDSTDPGATATAGATLWLVDPAGVLGHGVNFNMTGFQLVTANATTTLPGSNTLSFNLDLSSLFNSSTQVVPPPILSNAVFQLFVSISLSSVSGDSNVSALANGTGSATLTIDINTNFGA